MYVIAQCVRHCLVRTASLSTYGTAQYVRYRSDAARAAPLDTMLIDIDDDAQRAVTRADVHGEWKTAVTQLALVRPGSAPAPLPASAPGPLAASARQET